jgi:hypothetical protein
MQVFMVACDPGMIIRQASYTGQGPSGGSAPAEQVVVSVKKVTQLIGETWYYPDITVTNNSESPILVTDIELLAQGKAYAGDSRRTGAFPLTIQPASVGRLEVSFHLEADVQKTFFRRPAELLVHFQSGAEQKIARARIVGANLAGSR